MRIYVASSWRNLYQQAVVAALRARGHEVYDFRHPVEGNEGFHWSEIDPNWQQWTEEEFVAALKHPIAEHGFGFDWRAMQLAHACVLVLPCGRSAHLEAGWFVGADRPLHILTNDSSEPELMYKMATGVHTSFTELAEAIEK